MRILLLALLLTGCGSQPVFTRGALVDQELRFRPGYTGPGHQVCLEYDGDRCKRMDVMIYDMTRPEVREQLRALSFSCKVGEKRFRVCKDKPGFCHGTKKCELLIFCKYKEIEFIELPGEIQRLIDAGAYCAALGTESERSMW